MSSTTSGSPAGPLLPDYVPVPPSALGPALSNQGYCVGRVERNLFWVTDGPTSQGSEVAAAACDQCMCEPDVMKGVQTPCR
jgi:hypothetical protein